MNVVKKIVCVSLSSLLLASCSSHYASNRDNLYLKSRNGVALVVPPPMTTGNLGYFYNLPLQTQDASVDIKPPQ